MASRTNHLNKRRKLRNPNEDVLMLIFAALQTTLKLMFTQEIIVKVYVFNLNRLKDFSRHGQSQFCANEKLAELS